MKMKRIQLIFALIVLISFIASETPENSSKLKKKCGKGINFLIDLENCGGCGIRCPKDSRCLTGKCVCNTGLKRCGKSCVNLSLDADNCGVCKNKCSQGFSCIEGKCIGAKKKQGINIPGTTKVLITEAPNPDNADNGIQAANNPKIFNNGAPNPNPDNADNGIQA